MASGIFSKNRDKRFITGGFLSGGSLPHARCQPGSPCRVHPDNKKDNGKQDKPELGNIDEHTLQNCEEDQIYHVDDRKEEKEEQTCQKFEFTPFHCKDYCNESDK